MTGEASQPQPRLQGTVFAHGFSWRKRRLLKRFTPGCDLRFVRDASQLAPDVQLLLWGSAPLPHGTPDSVKVIRVEDGFLRSVGLGADLIRPLSWIVDGRGIYYDANRPSDLEVLLQDGVFDAALLNRAAAFRRNLVESRLSKYNLAAPPWRPPARAGQVVLVPGQVETDASIMYGALDIRTNMDLLRAVRSARPDAWLVYKPHPDVVAGLRRAGAQDAAAATLCNEILLHAEMAQLLDQVDEVHVMTSLTGFEALLRGKRVYCYGQPFYAGWGLTQDRHPQARRTRHLSVDELTAAALIEYPVYASLESGQICSPEQALKELLLWRRKSGGPVSWWRRWLRPLLARP